MCVCLCVPSASHRCRGATACRTELRAIQGRHRHVAVLTHAFVTHTRRPGTNWARKLLIGSPSSSLIIVWLLLERICQAEWKSAAESHERLNIWQEKLLRVAEQSTRINEYISLAKRRETDHAVVSFQQFSRRSSRVRAIEEERERRKAEKDTLRFSLSRD